MWHEVALTGVMTICLISKVDAPGVSTPIRQAYLWVGPDWTLLRRARKSSINSELGLQRASAPICGYGDDGYPCYPLLPCLLGTYARESQASCS